FGASHRGCIHCFVLHCGHGPLGPAVLLRLHGAAVWLVARASHFGERTEQTGGGAVARIFRWMDGGPLRAAPAYAGGNFDGRRGGAVDFAYSGATFWLASGASNARTFDSGDCTSRGVAGERAPAREKEHRESWIRGRARRVHHNSFFSADARQHVFHSRSQWHATKLETFSEFGSSFR